MKPESATTFVFAVEQHGKFLSTRELGKKVLRDMEDRVPAGAAAVAIDFTSVIAMTHSLTDEFLGQYYSSLSTHDSAPATVTLTGMNDDVRETVIVCLERRDLIALGHQDEQLALLAASEVLNQTFTLALDLRKFTATNVADHLNITAPNANNRLKRLVAARALIRQQRVADRGGKEFTYTVPVVG